MKDTETYNPQSGIPHDIPTSLDDVGYAGHLLRRYRVKNSLTAQIVLSTLLGASEPISSREIGFEIATLTRCIITIPSINAQLRRMVENSLVVSTEQSEHNQPKRYTIHREVESKPRVNTISITDDEIAALKLLLHKMGVKDD